MAPYTVAGPEDESYDVVFSRELRHLELYEDELTSMVRSALDKHLNHKLGCSMSMPNDLQGLHNLGDKEQFFDLVRMVSEWDVLALEMKVRSPRISRGPNVGSYRFPSYLERQHIILAKLSENEVPVYYCYNNVDNIRDGDNYERALELTNVVEPSIVCENTGLLTRLASHQKFIEFLEWFTHQSGGGEDFVRLAFFSRLLARGRHRWGARRLLILYSLKHAQYVIWNDAAMEIVADLVEKYVGAQLPDLNGLHNKSNSEIVEMLRNFKDTLNAALSTGPAP